ncbi:O-antigen ligase family protein [Luteibacter sp.]|uniref:O-antigen ligase family protein n=1 Tax=Luteibacter sp. TaxID=1886636 RepID=UPI002806CA21|nr:O-antigen ligase family protein [Luteibacter sp.]MDQ8051363.1 O-antigen ligase family protein [Luteibacter sp.]
MSQQTFDTGIAGRRDGRRISVAPFAEFNITPRLLRVALCSLGFLAFFAMTDFDLYMRPEFGALAALVAMCFAGRTPWRELRALPVVRMLGIFIAFLIVHALYATWVVPGISYSDQLSTAAKLVRLGVFCCVVGWWLSVCPRAIPGLLGLMVLGLLVAVLYHMPWHSLPAIWDGEMRPRFGIPENLSGQLAAVGGWLSLCLLIGIWRDHPRGGRRTWLLAVGITAYAGSFCVLLFSQSRGAWLAFLSATPVAIIGYWLTRRPRGIRTLPWQPIVLGALISLLLALGARDIFAIRFAGAERMLPAAEQAAGVVAPAKPAPMVPAVPAAQTSPAAAAKVAESPRVDSSAAASHDELAPDATEHDQGASAGPVPSAATASTLDTTVPGNKAIGIRMRLYELGMQKFKERPLLGWGLDSTGWLIESAHLDLAGERHVHLHNAYLDALVGMGLVGSLLLLTLFALVIRELVLAWRGGIISTASFWALAGCVGIVLVANAFDSLLWRFEYARAPQELLFGCCIAYALIRRRERLSKAA